MRWLAALVALLVANVTWFALHTASTWYAFVTGFNAALVLVMVIDLPAESLYSRLLRRLGLDVRR